jgi:hypothetical protein
MCVLNSSIELNDVFDTNNGDDLTLKEDILEAASARLFFDFIPGFEAISWSLRSRALRFETMPFSDFLALDLLSFHLSVLWWRATVSANLSVLE